MNIGNFAQLELPVIHVDDHSIKRLALARQAGVGAVASGKIDLGAMFRIAGELLGVISGETGISEVALGFVERMKVDAHAARVVALATGLKGDFEVGHGPVGAPGIEHTVAEQAVGEGEVVVWPRAGELTSFGKEAREQVDPLVVLVVIGELPRLKQAGGPLRLERFPRRLQELAEDGVVEFFLEKDGEIDKKLDAGCGCAL